MSMYNMIFETGEKGFILLKVLGIKSLDEIGRYRNAWLEKDESGIPRIAIYTRNGGGNRKDYKEIFENLSKHPNYLFDKDDNFDETYATIYFSLPETFIKKLNKYKENWIEDVTEVIDMSKEWEKAIGALGE